MLRCFALSVLLVIAPLAALADARLSRLVDLLRLADYVAITRTEGLADATAVATDMLGHAPHSSLADQIMRIHDPVRMLDHVQRRLDETLPDEHRDAILLFLDSGPGQRIMDIELAARQAFSDPDVESAGIAAWEQARDNRDKAALFERLDSLSNAFDLLDRNVTGALNTQMQFYGGLADGNQLDMGEAEILSQVWEQEDIVRSETERWIGGYVFMAYGALDSEDLDAYVTFAQSPPGQALNNAVFAAFNTVYDELSYALGRVLALNMGTQEL